ncbi:MAG: FMN-binding protein [Candidatus Aminicenantes bacterium]
MNLSARMMVVLTSVGIISGALLALVGLMTEERIALNKQREIEQAILTVVPGTQTSQKLYQEKDLSVYGAKDESGQLTGFAIHASGVGFQDKITLMIGTNPDLSRIKSLAVLDQTETPGLGAKIADKDTFLKYWENKDATHPLTLRKPPARSPQDLGPSEVNTITGATISSESVLTIVNSSLERVKTLKSTGNLNRKPSHAQ